MMSVVKQRLGLWGVFADQVQYLGIRITKHLNINSLHNRFTEEFERPFNNKEAIFLSKFISNSFIKRFH